jgi:hypothetical protein
MVLTADRVYTYSSGRAVARLCAGQKRNCRGSGAHKALYTMVTGGIFQGGKVATVLT